jgi:hypothetical protein
MDFQNKGQRHTVGVLLVIVWDLTSCAWALSLHTCTYVATHPSIITSRKETSSSFHHKLLKIYWQSSALLSQRCLLVRSPILGGTLPCWSATASNPYSPQKSSMVTEAGLSMFCSIDIRLSIHHMFFRKEIPDYTVTMWRSWYMLHWHGNVIMSYHLSFHCMDMSYCWWQGIPIKPSKPSSHLHI